MKKITIVFLISLIYNAPQIYAQAKLLSEEALSKKVIYTDIRQAYRIYDKVYRFSLKGTGGYYGKVTAVPAKIDSLIYLQYFSVVNEALENLPDSFGCLEMMQQLYLSGNKFKSIPDTVYSLKYLKRLDMGNNQLNQISDKIKNLKELEYLYINDNRDLDNLPVEAILKLKNLKFFNAKNTKIPREHLIKIQKALPNAVVEF